MCARVYMCVCTCMCLCKQLPGNQSFDRQISAYKKGGGVRRVRQWIGLATAYKFVT